MNQSSLYKICSSVVLFIGLVGCSIPVKQETLVGEIAKGEIANKFVEVDPVSSQPVQFDLDKYNFSAELVKLSKYGQVGYVTTRDGIAPYHGLRVQKIPSGYTFTYRNGEYYKSTGSIYASDVEFVVHTSLVESKKLVLELDSNYSIMPKRNIVGLEQDLLDDVTSLAADVNNIIRNANGIVISKSGVHQFSGEVNVEYPAESVYANFDRLLGKYKKSNNESYSEFKIEDSYNLKLKDRNFPLSIEVYPYRNGSKVLYKSMYSYVLSSNGNSTYEPDIGETIAEIVKSTANN